MALSAPIARPVLNCCWQSSGPMETIMTSLALPLSFILKAASRAISSKGLMLILTPSVITPLSSGLILILML